MFCVRFFKNWLEITLDLWGIIWVVIKMISSMVNQHSNIMESTDIVNEYLMEGDYADIIYLIFGKVFDVVSHYCLVVKMKTLVFLRNSEYEIELTDRIWMQKNINNDSKTYDIPSCVPLWLGPLLFLININYLPKDIILEIKRFANDGKSLTKETIEMDLKRLS